MQLLEPRQVRLDHLVVPVDREDQRDVDVVALGDLVLDRGKPLFGRGDLDHDVGPPAPIAQVLGHRDRASRVVRERRRDLDADEAVLAFGLVVDRPEHVRGGLDVLDHHSPEHVRGLGLVLHQPDHRLVVVGRAADGFLEDGRVGRDSGESLVAQARELAGADQLAADVVEPERLAGLLELFDRAGSDCRCHHFAARSLVAAATMCLAEMPAAFISSSGLPEVGSALTARCAIFVATPSPARASMTAAPRPPSG